MHHQTELSFVDEFRWILPIHYLKNGWQNTVLLRCMCKRGCNLYTTTAPSCCIPGSYCHQSATLQPMSNTVGNLQDSRAVFRIFIALLRFSVDSSSYIKSRPYYSPSTDRPNYGWRRVQTMMPLPERQHRSVWYKYPEEKYRNAWNVFFLLNAISFILYN
jgi:hypothetical protein